MGALAGGCGRERWGFGIRRIGKKGVGLVLMSE